MPSISIGRYGIDFSPAPQSLASDLLDVPTESYGDPSQYEHLGFLGVTVYCDGVAVLRVHQFYEQMSQSITPGVLIVPETNRLFIGAGSRMLAYDLTTCQRVWIEDAQNMMLFWSWLRQGQCVFALGELELAVYELDATPRFRVPVDPPWTFEVSGDVLTVETDSERRGYSMADGTPMTS